MSAELVDKAVASAEKAGLAPFPKKPVPAVIIRQCEQAIQHSFPKSYFHFLANYGFFGVGGVEFFGLLADDLSNPSHLNAYNFTKEMQENWNLPRELFAFENFDGDAVATLLLSRMANGECPVILWDNSEDFDKQRNEPHILAENFGCYLLEKTARLIEDESLELR